jgi:hypothetical protein
MQAMRILARGLAAQRRLLNRVLLSRLFLSFPQVEQLAEKAVITLAGRTVFIKPLFGSLSQTNGCVGCGFAGFAAGGIRVRHIFPPSVKWRMFYLYKWTLF